MKDDVTMFVITLFVEAMMLEFGRLPEKIQSMRTNPFVVLAKYMTSSFPAEFPLKMQDVIDGA
jgi:hypothetical protein